MIIFAVQKKKKKTFSKVRTGLQALGVVRERILARPTLAGSSQETPRLGQQQMSTLQSNISVCVCLYTHCASVLALCTYAGVFTGHMCVRACLSSLYTQVRLCPLESHHSDFLDRFPQTLNHFFLPAVPKYLCALVAPAGKGDPELPVQRRSQTAAQSCAGAPRCAAAGAVRTDAPSLKIPGSSFLSELGLTANGVGAPLV